MIHYKKDKYILKKKKKKKKKKNYKVIFKISSEVICPRYSLAASKLQYTYIEMKNYTYLLIKLERCGAVVNIGLEIERYRVRAPLTSSVVSLSKRLYPHC